MDFGKREQQLGDNVQNMDSMVNQIEDKIRVLKQEEREVIDKASNSEAKYRVGKEKLINL